MPCVAITALFTRSASSCHRTSDIVKWLKVLTGFFWEKWRNLHQTSVLRGERETWLVAVKYLNRERVTTENCALSTPWSLFAPKLAGLLTGFSGLSRERRVVAFLSTWLGACLPGLEVDTYLFFGWLFKQNTQHSFITKLARNALFKK